MTMTMETSLYPLIFIMDFTAGGFQNQYFYKAKYVNMTNSLQNCVLVLRLTCLYITEDIYDVLNVYCYNMFSRNNYLS